MTDVTTQILIEIRDELRQTNGRLDQTNGRLHQTNGRLDQTNERLEQLAARQTQTELRLATEIVAVAGAVHELRDLLIEDRKQAARLDDHERRIAALEAAR